MTTIENELGRVERNLEKIVEILVKITDENKLIETSSTESGNFSWELNRHTNETVTLFNISND